MSAPVLTSVGERLYEAVDPFTFDEENQGFALAHFCLAIARMFDQVASYAEDRDDGTPGWGAMLDPDLVPIEAIGWTGQFVGVEIPDGLTEDQQRTLVKDVGGFRRGTKASIVAAAQLYLTGTKTIMVNERVGGDAYRISVSTIDTETPSSGAVLQAILSEKPAGIQIDYSILVSAPSYTYVSSTFGAYTDLPLSYYDYDDLVGRQAVAHLAPYSTIVARFTDYNNIVASLASYKLLREQHV